MGALECGRPAPYLYNPKATFPHKLRQPNWEVLANGGAWTTCPKVG
jgi:hypothetical protein